ncbi:Cyanovirin-N-like protein [Verticillium dahliae VDG2]|nr:Cyanovirin-N-like protein [Verticillium dahliae VDG2]
MQYSLASLAVLALATSAAAQEFITFTRASQSTRDFGLLRRQSDGYQPEDEVCAGEGSTCAEACGTGYLQCSSSDSSVHCYNPAANESCCSTGTGSSCLSNFYCTHDTQVETWCCPNGLSLKECAVKFGVTGALTSDLPKATSTSSAYKLPSTTTTATTSSSSTTSTTTTTTTSTTSSVVVETTSAPVIESSTVASINSTSYAPVTSSVVPTSSSSLIAAANTTSTRRSSTFHSAAPTVLKTSAAAVPSPSQVNQDSAALANGPASLALVASMAFLFALF